MRGIRTLGMLGCAISSAVMRIRRAEAVAVLLLVMGLGSIARADLSPVPTARNSAITPWFIGDQSRCAEATDGPLTGNDYGIPAEVQPWVDPGLPVLPLPEKVCEVQAMPPAPSSASLFLCALGTFGVWHLTRSSSKISFGAAPEWLHVNGPNQIGHTFVIDVLDLEQAPVRIRAFDRPGEDPEDLTFLWAADSCSGYKDQHDRPSRAPRAPPSQS